MCGVSHHPPLTLTPLGLASQDFRLASGTLFTLAGGNFRGGGFLTALRPYLLEKGNRKLVSCVMDH